MLNKHAAILSLMGSIRGIVEQFDFPNADGFTDALEASLWDYTLSELAAIRAAMDRGDFNECIRLITFPLTD